MKFDSQFTNSIKELLKYEKKGLEVNELFPDEYKEDWYNKFKWNPINLKEFKELPNENEQEKELECNWENYVKMKIYEKLFGKNGERLIALKWIQNGFTLNFDKKDKIIKKLHLFFKETLSKLNHEELELLLCGYDYLDCEMILNILNFNEIREPHFKWFKELIETLNENELRNFLRWTIGLPTLSFNKNTHKNEMKIRLIKSDRFYTHTCITILSLELNTNIKDEKQFKEELKNLLNKQ
jgi:hypothetical protein